MTGCYDLYDVVFGWSVSLVPCLDRHGDSYVGAVGEPELGHSSFDQVSMPT